MQKVGVITTFRHSINATRESNENGRFSARLGLVNLMLGYYQNVRGRKICGVFTFTEAYLYAKVLPDYIRILWAFSLYNLCYKLI